jgi:hypothetical protein
MVNDLSLIVAFCAASRIDPRLSRPAGFLGHCAEDQRLKVEDKPTSITAGNAPRAGDRSLYAAGLGPGRFCSVGGCRAGLRLQVFAEK